MGYKIFVSYKYQDHDVAKLEGGKNQTPEIMLIICKKLVSAGMT
ncbi:hypothetical protein SDC49_19110 [Lactobacillus sp. R2/2]|nr:hypothetical protein [Lactobacillus sp. R2/2]